MLKRNSYLNRLYSDHILMILRPLILFIVLSGLFSCRNNHPPVITGITCTPEARSAGTLFSLTAAAVDEDGDPLQYHWSADGGLFPDSVNGSSTTWRSPVDGNGKTFTVRITVSDGKLETYLDYPMVLSAPVFGQLKGYAFFSNCTVPVSGVAVTAAEKTTVTDQNGYFFLSGIPVGSYSLEATKAGFSNTNQIVNLYQFPGLPVTIPMASTVYTSIVVGFVRTLDSLAISGARVTMLNPDDTESKLAAVTSADGFYRIRNVPVGQRKFIVRKVQTEEFGFEEVIQDVSVSGPEYLLNFGLPHYNLLGQITDYRDEHLYGTKILGTQTWMTENLAYLPAVSPSGQGSDTSAFYYVFLYEGDSVKEAKSEPNYATYGVLYNWTAARSACPAGWHLPSDVEWKILENYLGSDASFRLKSVSGWTNSGNGNNSSGFNVLPAGERLKSLGFTDLGNIGKFWSNTILTGHGIWTRSVRYDDNVVYRLANTPDYGVSVRCIRD